MPQKRWTFYWFTFADGHQICCRGFNAMERAREVAAHGEIIERKKA